MLCPTPDHRRLDRQGRPYFLWDCDWTESQFRALLRDEDDATRAVLLARVMRQAKPDDAFLYTTEAEIRRLWTRIEPHLGQTRAFWTWLLDAWAVLDGARAQ
jgi:hypothetical protein